MEENCSNLVVPSKNAALTDIVLRGERLNAPPQDEERARLSAHSTLNQHWVGTPSHRHRARKRYEKHTNW